ncbi:MAG: hypothetical protein OXT67_09605 [Zetaproteobacteria bacterium]|nr:hypothetical protein [Zetaproteobacteria bacterium]
MHCTTRLIQASFILYFVLHLNPAFAASSSTIPIPEERDITEQIPPSSREPIPRSTALERKLRNTYENNICCPICMDEEAFVIEVDPESLRYNVVTGTIVYPSCNGTHPHCGGCWQIYCQDRRYRRMRGMAPCSTCMVFTPSITRVQAATKQGPHGERLAHTIVTQSCNQPGSHQELIDDSSADRFTPKQKMVIVVASGVIAGATGYALGNVLDNYMVRLEIAEPTSIAWRIICSTLATMMGTCLSVVVLFCAG